GLVSTDCDVQPCTSAEYPSKVRRPPYSVLDKSKITQALGRPVPEWRESLEGYLDEMRNDAT
ncbi:MAG TPA: sugar nucleotide-binding protein, partial [Treponemataceae bacterium]|nr:sugar nucleotide-binding protein [Treponemataceae bacterium]